jgi:carboxylesterase
MSRILPGAEPFHFRGGTVGCLLLHGYTGTPKEMRELGEHLAAAGHTVLGIRLPGHGTNEGDLQRMRAADWLASVEDGRHLLRSSCTRLVLLGLSMGGVLSLLTAARHAVDGVVAMATPYRTPDPRARWLRPLGRPLSLFWRYAAKGPSDWRDRRAEADHLSYRRLPVRAGLEVDKLIRTMRHHLPRVTAPALLIYSRGDAAVPPSHAEALHRALGSARKEIFWVENSGHVLTRDAERGRVFEAVSDFVRRIAEAGP